MAGLVLTAAVEFTDGHEGRRIYCPNILACSLALSLPNLHEPLYAAK